MQRRLMKLLGLVVVAVLASLPAACGGMGGGGAAPDEATGAFDRLDLSGVWRNTTRRTALGGSAISANRPPFTVEGQVRFDANRPAYGPRAIPPALGNDPTGNCDPHGVPRVLLLEFPSFNMEILQTPGRTLQFFDWGHVWRDIWTDGRELPTDDPDPRWLGYSSGRWEGDTFVVESIGFDDRKWLDHLGHPHSAEMSLEERYRRVDADTLELEIILTDLITYTEPWTGTKILERVPDEELGEYFCVPSVETEFNRRMRDPAGGVNAP